MAIRRRTFIRRRTVTRRTYRRSGRYGKRRAFKRYGRVTTRQNKLAFSRSQLVRLRYCQQVTLNPNADSGAYIVYSANGPQSPNISNSTGVSTTLAHQPYGWDQWSAIYNDYIVLGSKITVTAGAPNSTNQSSAAGILGVLLSDSPSPYSVTTSAGATVQMESGRCAFKQFNSNGNGKPVILSKKFSAKKFWNVSKLKDNVVRLGAAVSATPNEQAYYHLSFYSNDESISTSAGPYCWVAIDYILLFSGPADLQAS